MDCSSPMSASTSVEHGQLGRDRRRAQPGLMQQRHKAECLQRHRLPAGVGPADDERAHFAEIEVDRDRLCRVEQGMPRSDQPDRVGCANLRTAPASRENGASERKVDRAGRLHEHRKSGGLLADPRRELADDPLDLFPLGARRLGELVVELDDCERLDEERLPGARRIVHDPRHLAACADLHGQHRPSAALGDECLLQEIAKRARAGELRQLLDCSVTSFAQLRAKLPQQRRCVVAQVGAVLLDGGVDRSCDGRERGIDRFEQRAELLRGDARDQRLSCGQRDVHGPRDPVQLVDAQAGPERSALRSVAHVVDSAERRLRALVVESDSLARQCLQSRDLICIR